MTKYIYGKIHGYPQIYKIENDSCFMLDKTKKGLEWFPTLVEGSRLKKFKEITVEELVSIVSPIRG
jgi:hypothetical protein